jgi:hypothetical protein
MAAKKKVTDDQPLNVDATRATVNNATRSDAGGVAAAQHGHFVRVVSGCEAGRYGVLIETISTTPAGLPDDVLIKTRDDDSMLLPVKYSDLVADVAGGR